MNTNGAIGFMDSGVGGLTVMEKAIKLMPNENFIYMGDTKNCPYGNRSANELLALGKTMLGYLKRRNVKCVMLACNTMSSLGEILYKEFDFPVIRIITCVSGSVTDKSIRKLGILATDFTVKSGLYESYLKKDLPDCEFVGVASKNLARLVEFNDLDGIEIRNEIKTCIDKILSAGGIKDIILGCTHFPIAMKTFNELYPDINFIDPATAQARYLKNFLESNNATCDCGGKVELFTSGELAPFMNLSKIIGIDTVHTAISKDFKEL